jgi:hypothetical protein
MVRIGRRLVAALAVSVAVAAPAGARVAGAQQGEIVLHIDNHAQVAAGDLARARAEVERAFRAAGIVTTWAEAGPSTSVMTLNAGGGPRNLVVRIVHNTDPQTRGAKGCALGAAVPAIGTAYVYVNRIVETSRRRPVDVPVALGRVMTHEFGHLLLPPGSHSRFGIMRADLDVAYENPSLFINDHVRMIQTSLARPGVEAKR